MTDEKKQPGGFDLSKLTPEQRIFFQAAGKYPVSVTAQGIELYRTCRDKGVHYNAVFDSVFDASESLIPFTESVHQRVGGSQQNEAAANVSLNKEGFVGILSSVVDIAEELTDAEKAGHPLSEQQLQEYLRVDYPQLIAERNRLKSETEQLIAQTTDETRRGDLRKLLTQALSQLENNFRDKIVQVARQAKNLGNDE